MKMEEGKFISEFKKLYCTAYKYKFYRLLIILFGHVFSVMALFNLKNQNRKANVAAHKRKILDSLATENKFAEILQEERAEILKINRYFGDEMVERKIEARANKNAKKRFEQLTTKLFKQKFEKKDLQVMNFRDSFLKMLDNRVVFYISLLLAFPMYLVVLVFKFPFLKYSLERIFMLIFVIFGVVFVVFSILWISPSDPAINVLGRGANQEAIDAWRISYGLDKSYIEQLFQTFKSVITFDFGNSYQSNLPVTDLIVEKFPITFKIALLSILVAVLIAVPAGIISAIKQYSKFDYIAMTTALVGLSIPNFWLGLMLILVFAVNLGWVNVLFELNSLKSMILPAVVIGTSLAAAVARMTRSSMLEVTKADYVITARAKGLPESKVIFKHTFRNAIIPIITMIGLQFGLILGGASVTEKVFSIPGIGDFMLFSQFLPDNPAVIASVVYIAIIISITNLLVDLLYAIFDPRIKSKIREY